jgi:hypothetical protein
MRELSVTCTIDQIMPSAAQYNVLPPGEAASEVMGAFSKGIVRTIRPLATVASAIGVQRGRLIAREHGDVSGRRQAFHFA